MNNNSMSAPQQLSLSSVNTFLAVLLAVQLVVVWLSFHPNEEITQPVVTFFDTIQSDQINHLSITDTDANSLHFSLNSEGKWQIEQNDGQPVSAHHQSVVNLLGKLTNLQSERVIALTKSSHNRLQVDEAVFSRKVTLRDTNGKEQVLFVGSSSSSQSSYVRSGKSEKVYQVEGITSWELDTDSDAWFKE